jgi:hypothetical protein
MDCKTARLLLEFSRPGELEPADAAGLEGHLDGCPDCAAAAEAGRLFDQRVGAALNDVPPPAGLRERLLLGLGADRHALRRAALRRAAPWAGAAAALVLLGTGAVLWFAGQRTVVSPERVWENVAFAQPSTREDVETSFGRMGVTVVAPPDYDYALLTNHCLAELPGYPGQRIPQLVFRRDTPSGSRHAIVYVLDTRRFEVSALEDEPSGSPYKISRRQSPSDRFAYLIVYNGDGLSWLSSPPVATQRKSD